mmetsp:Transcript_40459/g.131008  ORF Transcript_40459/g.131008 Transcript_40459/m.131008 type:complete len:220 (+) Transcript_40459:1476-2135(+)
MAHPPRSGWPRRRLLRRHPVPDRGRHGHVPLCERHGLGHHRALQARHQAPQPHHPLLLARHRPRSRHAAKLFRGRWVCHLCRQLAQDELRLLAAEASLQVGHRGLRLGQGPGLGDKLRVQHGAQVPPPGRPSRPQDAVLHRHAHCPHPQPHPAQVQHRRGVKEGPNHMYWHLALNPEQHLAGSAHTQRERSRNHLYTRIPPIIALLEQRWVYSLAVGRY